MSELTDGSIHHYDPDQLLFQLHEIHTGNAYLRHGVEIHPGGTVLDVGANVGVSAIFFAEQGAGAVHAFEPIPVLYELLEENLRPHQGCVAHPYGMGTADEVARFTFYPKAAAMSSRYADPDRDAAAVRAYMAGAGRPADPGDPEFEGKFEGEQVDCEIRALSRVIAEEGIEGIDLLKIDVERAEHEVLAGIADDDWKLIRQIVIEVHDHDGRCAAIVEQLRSEGFTVVADQDPVWSGTDVKMVYGVRNGG